MGRYYNGDINGKFWFAVQPSNDADFFGGESSEPEYVHHYFYKDDIKDIKNGIKECENKLGKFKKMLDVFFEKRDSYNNVMIEKKFKINKKKVEELLEFYARLELGEKILKCVEKKGECSFDSEL